LVAYCTSNLKVLPSVMTMLDTNRLSIVFFSVSSLDLIGCLDGIDRKAVVEWIYALQVLPEKGEDSPTLAKQAGFVGGTFLGTKYDPVGFSRTGPKYAQLNHGHVAMTYFALATLSILGDKFERVNRKAIVHAMTSLQRVDGSFSATAFGSEAGMRFLYCACAVSYMLNDWSAVDRDLAAKYISSCRSYDGGAMGLIPGQESHGGSTYCALAALKLMGRLDDVIGSGDGKEELVRWCVHRQVSGFQGRRNKVPDTCYSFWVGASLCMLDAFDLIDKPTCRAFHERCRSVFGGFLKLEHSRFPDPLHTYFSICAMSMLEAPGFGKLNPELCISQRAASGGVWQRVVLKEGVKEEEKEKETGAS